MKKLSRMFYISLALMVLLAACAPASTPIPSAVPLADTATSAATETSTSAPPTATSTTALLDLAGPPMQVGSTYLYFDGSLLVAVPGGPFIMGHGGSDNPEHTVTLSDFWIYSTKVTNREYQQCVAVGKCTVPNTQDDMGYSDPQQQNNPATGVNWAQSEAYCEYANGHLPTEAQWEKVARGPNGNIYPWGNNMPDQTLLNYFNFVGHTTDVVDYVKGKSYYDALDMEGNAYEWVYDWYDPLYYKTGSAQDPQGPDQGHDRSVRSSGYKSNNDQVVASIRSHSDPIYHARDLGFRCIVKDPMFFAPFCQAMVVYGMNTPGGSNSGGANNKCPDPKIIHTEDCAVGNTPVNDIHLQSTPPTKIDSVTGGGTCNPPLTNPSDTAGHVCPLGVTISITASCDIPASSADAVACPSGYNLSSDGKTCTAQGAPGQCPAGSQYNQQQMCCTALPGGSASMCAAGFHEYQGACVPDNSGLYNPNPQSYTTNSGMTCQPGGSNPGGSSCSLPSLLAQCKQNCRYGCISINVNTCSIVCNPG